ncbi:MAG: hypothetical protein WBE74_26165 [Terracidiphilus sp.]
MLSCKGYIEISLDSEYCYNPLHNDLDAYALAYNIASLLNNLFGRGKEPFWQQAYTNLVKFIILLHKAAYDYVTLRDFTIDGDSPEMPLHSAEAHERRRTLPADHKTQSEHDWAYAKRALARGDDPEIVIQRIADYRAADKDDPNYYARRTVTKAQAELKSSTAPQIHGSPESEGSSQNRDH